MPVLVVTQPINALAFVADGALFGELLPEGPIGVLPGKLVTLNQELKARHL